MEPRYGRPACRPTAASRVPSRWLVRLLLRWLVAVAPEAIVDLVFRDVVANALVEFREQGPVQPRTLVMRRVVPEGVFPETYTRVPHKCRFRLPKARTVERPTIVAPRRKALPKRAGSRFTPVSAAARLDPMTR